jgi:hypothetical protein
VVNKPLTKLTGGATNLPYRRRNEPSQIVNWRKMPHPGIVLELLRCSIYIVCNGTAGRMLSRAANIKHDRKWNPALPASGVVSSVAAGDQPRSRA